MKEKLYLYITSILAVMIFVMAAYQVADYFSLIHKLKSFTAEDGQSLCLRIQTMEKDQLIVKPCEYNQSFSERGVK
jgi:hypothetical protein